MKKSAGFLCAVVLAIISNGFFFTTSGQTTDPASLPLLFPDGLQYLGGFRLPVDASNGEWFSFGGAGVAFNPSSNSLFVSSAHGLVAEVGIPAPVNSSDVSAMPYASYLQPFADPMEGHLSEIAGAGLTGLLVRGNRLYGTASIYFDVSNTQRVSHFSRSLQLNQPSFSGWSQVAGAGLSGFVSGWMTNLPNEWQAKLGGPALTGQCCIPIVGRTSAGPAAMAFDPANVGQPVVNAVPLLYYPGDHPTLGPWEGSNPTYGAATKMGGLAALAGTRTVLYFGSNGLGEHCYGNGTSDRSLVGTIGPDNEKYCYDPTTNTKGSHAYPYRYQVWAYDLNDFAAVKAGTKQPWEVVPYGVWPLTLPTPEVQVVLGGVAYDPQRQLLYLAQHNGDPYGNLPVIHVFRVSATASAAAPSTSVSSVTLTADKIAPQPEGSAVTFTAQPTGGVAPHEYKWIVSDGSVSTVAATWSAGNRFTWTPSAANANYRVSVWVRSAGNTADVLEGSASLAFPIGALTAATTPATAITTAVALTANRVAPQAPMTAITWTATPVGGVAPHQYKWRVFDGAAWTVSVNWSTTNSFVWTPSTANANYRVEVWVRSASNIVDAQEVSTATAFSIENATSIAFPSASVSLAADKPAPQAAGTTITFTATPSGGTAPFVYKWFVFNGTTWNTIGSWTSTATFTWTPGLVNTNHRIRVWVKSAANVADQPEATADQAFPITEVTSAAPSPAAPTVPAPTPTPPTPSAPEPPPTPAPTPAPAPIPPAAGVSLAADRLSPQPGGTRITFTATPSGVTEPHLFKWFVSDGNTWTVIGGWTSSGTFTWTPAVANSNYRIRVWVKSSLNTVDQPEASAEQAFSINAATSQ